MRFAFLAVIAMLSTPAQESPQADPVAVLVQQLEQAAVRGDRDAIRSLGNTLTSTADLAVALTSPPPSRIVIKERDRTAIEGGQRLLIEVFWERGQEGRLGTWSLDVSPGSGGWRIASAARLAHVTGLFRLALNRAKQFDIRNLTVRAPDLTLSIPAGSAFVAETPDGVTAVVLIGRGQMRFAPRDAAEQTQVRIFSGDEVLASAFEAAFIRVRPEDFESRFPAESLVERAPSERDLRRADDVFEDYVGRTLQINLLDLSEARWSITPQPGDLIAEVRTSRFDTLTYTRSRNDAEDVTLFDRRRRRNISVYASEEKLASRGRFYNEDDLVDYDVLAYDLEASITPDRETIVGNARLKLKVRAAATTTINLRLAEELAVSAVYSPGHGRLLHLRVVNQNSLIVNLPGAVIHGSEFWLNIHYAGRMPPQELDREAISVGQNAQETIALPAEPRFIYSNRSYWYPQSVVSDYATVGLKITVPEPFHVVATGLPVGLPAPPPGVAPDGQRRRVFAFESERPVRYLSCVISRLREVESRQVDVGGTSPEGLVLHMLANPRQVGRAEDIAGRAADVLGYYARIVGDVPYPAFTLALTEREVPGGHSPAYFAVVDQPNQPGINWRNDPVNFDNYPSFFVAHEIAHQWWGQAIAGKNYHEQWLSEGLAQYFALLYAEEKLAPGVVANLLRQMRQTALRQSPQGPIYLGYRLGHIKGDARVFRSIVYNKAAMVLHMLRRLVGDEAFFAGVRGFFARWKYRKAGTDDFIAAMEEATARDLSGFFESWVFGAAVPRATFSYRVDGSEAILRLEQPGIPVEFPVSVRLTYRSGRHETVTLIAREKVSELSVDLAEPLKSATANADHATLVVID
ncbi:MAG TPA: M1 family aminopeptidase [Vicinamibacterales bacterium]|nr:M1 family aminopeptidase [Vicinamibacterales bacterium]